MIRTQLALLIVDRFAGPYPDGRESILSLWNAIKYALASLPGLDCSVQPGGRVWLFLETTHCG